MKKEVADAASDYAGTRNKTIAQDSGQNDVVLSQIKRDERPNSGQSLNKSDRQGETRKVNDCFT